MAYEGYLKIDGVEGESTDDKHKGEIEVLSFSWGATQAGSFSHGGGGGAGKVSFQDLNFVANIQKHSPVLMQKCATGEHFKKAVLSVRKAGEAGEEQQDYLVVTLTDILISSYSAGGSQTDQQPMEQVSVNFKKITMTVGARSEPPAKIL